VLLGCLLVGVGPVCHPTLGFSKVAVGTALEDEILQDLDGEPVSYLQAGQVSVFVFFRPGQENSRSALIQLDRLREELVDRPIHWTAIVSDSHPRGAIDALVDSAGIDLPVLIDEGNRLYGRLGVVLHPVIGIADQTKALAAYVPFHKVNLAVIVRAHIRHLLGEIDDERLAAVLDPKAAANGGDRVSAKRQWRLATVLLKMKKYDPALAAARESAEHDPDFAPAHALIGAILAAEGDCAAAQAPTERALGLDPREPTALATQNTCNPLAKP
jgi:tetratricopeptide (TPR) repeat protein